MTHASNTANSSLKQYGGVRPLELEPALLAPCTTAPSVSDVIVTAGRGGDGKKETPFH